jgi:hypothetical protein
MILSDVESEQLRPGDPGFAERMAAYAAFHEQVAKRGALLESGRLQATRTAATVRVRDGQVLVTDGPFAETKEQMGGFYLLECESREEALALAAQIPTALSGSVEVRPLWVW